MSHGGAKPISQMRMIVGSFAAGVGAMALSALVVSVAAGGGFSVQLAHAGTVEARAPAVEPLNLPVLEAQLNQADTILQVARARTDSEVARLERYSH